VKDLISKDMQNSIKNGSVIRAMFEEGKKRAKIYGAENVFDFSLGNPNVEPPEEIKQAIIDIVSSEKPLNIHGYMLNSGYEDVREEIAQSINRKYGTDFSSKNLVMTVGAAGGANVIFKTLLDPDDEVITFAPFFGEYKGYVSNFGGKLVVVSTNTVDFQPNLSEFRDKITARTKAVLINSPNNPTEVVYTEKTFIELSEILREKQKEFSTDIYLVSDEPYRELAYENIEVPYPTKYFENTIIVYSFSKSLSLPGERIGYLVIPNEAADYENVFTGAGMATRILGFVNAPSLFQRVAARCVDLEVDVEVYNRNRELLYNSLKSYGYECIKPEGAFYMFVKSPIADDSRFCAMAKEKNILVVPGSYFSCPGYFRIAYCVSYDTIKNALPGFKALFEEAGNENQ